MRKRGAVSVDVGEVSVRFVEERADSLPSEPLHTSGTSPTEHEDTPEGTEVHSLEEEDAKAAGPMASALAAPLQADLTDDRASEEDTERFETWYHTAPKPTSFAR